MSTGSETITHGRIETDRDPPESLRRIACLSLACGTVPEERLADLRPEEPTALAREVTERDRITECAVLSTCNRVEVYASTRTADRGDVETALAAAYEVLGRPEGAREYAGLPAVEHLARVACGLESAILGEDQILGQVNRAFERAEGCGLTGGALSRVAEAAVRVGRTCRDETAINDGEVGYGGAICRVVEEALDGPPGRVLVVGAGEMAGTAVDAIRSRWDARIDVANRSPATGLTTDDGRYWPLDEVDAAAAGADAVVSATGAPEAVLPEPTLADHDGPVVDLANPPDVPRGVRDDPDVATLRDLAAHVEGNADRRRSSVAAVEERIEAAIERLVARERENRAEDVLRELHRQAARVREEQLERALDRLEAGDADPEAVLDDFASALTGRLLADPTEALREAAREGEEGTIAAANRLFDLDGGEG